VRIRIRICALVVAFYTQVDIGN